jgi:hypothetical protein
MATTETIIIKGDSKGAVDALKAVNDEAKKTQKEAEKSSDAIKDGMEALDKRTGGAVSGFKSLTGGIKTAVSGFKTLKGAILATGLGALLVAITSLIAYFKETERGADALRVITGTLGAVIGKLTDVVIHLGEKLFNAFSDPKQAILDFGNAIKENITNRVEGMLELLPALGKAISLALGGKFREAGKVATDAVGKVTLGVENVTDKVGAAIDAVTDFGKSIVDAGKEGSRIAKIFNEVERAERELVVQRAKANKQIIEARFIADDLTKSTDERIKAVERAGKLEGEIAEKELATQRKKALALKQQADISESNKETLMEIAEAEARVSELETASIARKKRLGNEIKSLRAEAKAAADETQKAEDEKRKQEEEAASELAKKKAELFEKALDTLKTEQQREIDAVKKKYEELLSLDNLSTEQRIALEQKQSDEIIAINQKTADAQAAIDKSVADAKAAMINQSIDAVQGALGSLFEKSKGVATANVLIDSAQAAIGIFKNSTSLPEPFGSINRGVQLAALAASTAASIRNINRAEPTSAAAAPSLPQSPPATSVSSAPQFNVVGVGGINQLAESVNEMNARPVRAYVVAGEVTSQQNLNRRRARTATFG